MRTNPRLGRSRSTRLPRSHHRPNPRNSLGLKKKRELWRSYRCRTHKMLPKLTAAALFLGAGVSAALFLRVPLPLVTGAALAAKAAALASAVILLFASVLQFWWPRVAYGLAFASGLVAISWLIWTDFEWHTNPWIWLNFVPTRGEDRDFATLEKLWVLSLVIVVFAIACAAIRLVPSRWVIRERAVSTRTWPAVVIGFLVLAVWFVRSVSPYQVPTIVDGPSVDLRILHVVKRGLSISETRAIAYRSGSALVSWTNRRLFQYQFESKGTRVSSGESPAILERARALMRSPQLWALHTPPAKELWAWNAEGWYVTLKDSHLLAFTSEYPPRLRARSPKFFTKSKTCPASRGCLPFGAFALDFATTRLPRLGFWYSNQWAFPLMRRNN